MGLPLAPPTPLFPVIKPRALDGPIGLIADASCIIAVVAGTVGPIGFLDGAARSSESGFYLF